MPEIAIKRKEIKEFYNRIYEKGDIRDNMRLYRWVVKLINPKAGYKLFDVGSGVGCFLYEASRRGVKVIGMDISFKALLKARENFSDIRVFTGDGEKIPLKDNSLDYVVSLGSVEHFLIPEKGMQEFVRILKKNGRVALLLPNSFYLGDIFKVLFKGKTEEQWQIQEKLLSKEEWRELIEENGLKVEKIYGYNKYPELFQKGTLKMKSFRKLIQTLLMKCLCPLNLSWEFLYICKKPVLK